MHLQWHLTVLPLTVDSTVDALFGNVRRQNSNFNNFAEKSSETVGHFGTKKASDSTLYRDPTVF